MTESQIRKWLASRKPEKPLLVHGPLQSGKKTIIEKVLKESGYRVIHPYEDLDKQSDTGFFGEKHAFIMRMEELHFKSKEELKFDGMPGVKTAPVIYVCHNPYDYGTKAKLEARFQMIEMKSNRKFAPSWGAVPNDRDVKPAFWDAVEIVRSRSPLEQKLKACKAAGDYLKEIVHMSYIEKTKVSLDRIVKAADSLSLADTWDYKCLPEVLDVMKIIFPANYTLLSKDLVFKRPPVAEKNKFRPEKKPEPKKRAAPKKTQKPAAKKPKK